MKIDINKYRNNVTWIKNIIDRERQMASFDKKKSIGLLSSAGSIPLIAVMHFYGELYGFDEELKTSIKSVTKFYGYTEIVGNRE